MNTKAQKQLSRLSFLSNLNQPLTPLGPSPMHLNYLTIHSNMWGNIFSLQNPQLVSYFALAKKCYLQVQN